MAQDQTNQEATKAVEVGNKICPVSGEKIPAPGEKGEMGEAVKYEYNGKIYNLCCPMCMKDFKKDPEKYSKIAEDEVAKEKEENLDPHLDHNHNNS
jgi:YHS domain-containing protein